MATGIGVINTKRSWAPVLRLSAAFCLFQFAMPLAGWFAGIFGKKMEILDGVVLIAIGVKILIGHWG